MYVLNLVKADPFIQRNNIKLLVLQKFNVKILLTKISIIYCKLKLTWKKPKKYCVKDDTFLDEIEESRRNYEKTIENIISINEFGFNNLFLHTKGLSEK